MFDPLEFQNEFRKSVPSLTSMSIPQETLNEISTISKRTTFDISRQCK